jgi:hypothetical protein
MVEKSIMIVLVLPHAKPDLLEVRNAASLPCLFTCLRQCGQQHRGENGDNGNYNQQFNERKKLFHDYLTTPMLRIDFDLIQNKNLRRVNYTHFFFKKQEPIVFF